MSERPDPPGSKWDTSGRGPFGPGINPFLSNIHGCQLFEFLAYAIFKRLFWLVSSVKGVVFSVRNTSRQFTHV